MLKGKTVVLGITGSIAAYKMANVASMLAKQHCDVQVIMTKNATQFITPLTFETLCNTRCMVDTFDRNFQYNVEHVALAKRADLVMVAPASANIIAKMAHGIADDMLSTTVLACRCKKLVAPAMNTNMYENPITQDNLETLRRYGFGIIDPAVGMLACKDVGAGKLPKEELLYNHILQEILYPKDLAGKKVLVTAGPTCEPVDPVRIYTNRSSGKMATPWRGSARCAAQTSPWSPERPRWSRGRLSRWSPSRPPSRCLTRSPPARRRWTLSSRPLLWPTTAPRRWRTRSSKRAMGNLPSPLSAPRIS